MADNQVPAPVAYVRDLLDGFGATWLLGGGWAVDAWLGRTTRGATNHQVVLAWLLHQRSPRVVPLIGPRTPQQLEDALPCR